MFKQFLLYFCIIIILTSCNNYNGPAKPDRLISKNDMVNILIDSKIVNSATSANRMIMEKHGVVIDNYVFEKYKIDSLQFAESNNYYAHNIKDYEEIYDRVIDSLERLKVYLNDLKLKEEKEEKKRVTDSLNKIKERDSISNDSLQVLQKEVDSLRAKLPKNKKELETDGVLIKPVSDRD